MRYKPLDVFYKLVKCANFDSESQSEKRSILTNLSLFQTVHF